MREVRDYAFSAYQARGHACWYGYMSSIRHISEPSDDMPDRQWELRASEQDESNEQRRKSFTEMAKLLGL